MVLAVVGPVGVVITAGVLDRWAAMRPLEFTVAPRDGAACLQQVHYDLYGQVYVSPSDARNFAQMTPEEGRVRSVDLDDLKGKKVHGKGGRPAVVKAIDQPRSYGAFHRPTPILVLEQEDEPVRQDLLATCLLEGEPPVVLEELTSGVSDAALGPDAAAFVTRQHLLLVDRDEGHVRSVQWDRDRRHLTATRDGFFALTDEGLQHWPLRPDGSLGETRTLRKGGEALKALTANEHDLLLVAGRKLLRLSISTSEEATIKSEKVLASLPDQRWHAIHSIDDATYLVDFEGLWVLDGNELREVEGRSSSDRVVRLGDHLGWVATRSYGEMYRLDDGKAKRIGLRLGSNPYRGSAAGLWWAGWFGPREPGIRLVNDEGELLWDAAPGVDDPVFVAGDEDAVFWVSNGPERGKRVLSMRRRER
jgi:hypothetical protein